MEKIKNSGDKNSGNWNSGDKNPGNGNSGNYNSGNYNSGNYNSGYSNSGDDNSGDWNSGGWNSGDWNSGGWNPGNGNSGDWNSGNYNSGNWNSGFFNTNEPKLRIFNSETKLTKSEFLNKYSFPDYFEIKLTKWITGEDMTYLEKDENPDYKITEGFLKKYSYKEAWTLNFNKFCDKTQAEETINLPNFSYSIFEEITGISKKMLDSKRGINNPKPQFKDKGKLREKINELIKYNNELANGIGYDKGWKHGEHQALEEILKLLEE